MTILHARLECPLPAAAIPTDWSFVLECFRTKSAPGDWSLTLSNSPAPLTEIPKTSTPFWYLWGRVSVGPLYLPECLTSRSSPTSSVSLRPGTKCPATGCGTELKPLFSTLYCPNEGAHARLAAAAEKKNNCQHPIYIYKNGVNTCMVCKEELTVPLFFPVP